MLKTTERIIQQFLEIIKADDLFIFIISSGSGLNATGKRASEFNVAENGFYTLTNLSIEFSSGSVIFFPHDIVNRFMSGSKGQDWLSDTNG